MKLFISFLLACSIIVGFAAAIYFNVVQYLCTTIAVCILLGFLTLIIYAVMFGDGLE